MSERGASARGVSARLAQAEFLLQHRRFQDAESLLREMLATDPADGGAHALLAFALRCMWEHRA